MVLSVWQTLPITLVLPLPSQQITLPWFWANLWVLLDQRGDNVAILQAAFAECLKDSDELRLCSLLVVKRGAPEAVP